MGVRFACHVCGKQLNIKSELAGRRGICPGCSSRFRIPLADSEQSSPIDEPQRVMATPTVPESNPVATKRVAVGSGATSSPANAPINSPTGERTSTAAASAETTSAAVAERAPASPQSAPASSQSSGSLDLLVSDPTATWYVRPPSGGQYGPATGEILKQWIGEGRVASNALLWRDGWPQWREATEALPEMSQQLPDANAVAASPATSTTAKSTASTGQASASADEFGYEDSDFSKRSQARSQSNAYGGPTQAAAVKGQNRIGSQRRAKTSKRTLWIVVLGLLVLVLIAVLVYVMTR